MKKCEECGRNKKNWKNVYYTYGIICSLCRLYMGALFYRHCTEELEPVCG